MAQVCWSIEEKKKKRQRVQKRKKERHAGPAAGAVSKPARALKDEIHFVSSCAPSSPDEGSRGEEKERGGRSGKEAEMEGEICLICQKFFNLIYSCQDADDPDLITAFYLPDFTPGTRHSSLSQADTHTCSHWTGETEENEYCLYVKEQSGKTGRKSAKQIGWDISAGFAEVHVLHCSRVAEKHNDAAEKWRLLR